MTKVNGNGGSNDNGKIESLKNYYEALKAKFRPTQNVDVTSTQGSDKPKEISKEYGEELLTSNNLYYGAMGLNIKKVPEAGSLEELANLKATINVSNVSSTDRLQAFNSVQDPLIKAYMYGNINENTLSALSSFDGTSLPEFMANDLLAEVVVS